MCVFATCGAPGVAGQACSPCQQQRARLQLLGSCLLLLWSERRLWMMLCCCLPVRQHVKHWCQHAVTEMWFLWQGSWLVSGCAMHVDLVEAGRKPHKTDC